MSSLVCQSLEKVTASLPARKEGSLTTLSRNAQERAGLNYCRKDVSVIFFFPEEFRTFLGRNLGSALFLEKWDQSFSLLAYPFVVNIFKVYRCYEVFHLFHADEE